VIAIATGAK